MKRHNNSIDSQESRKRQREAMRKANQLRDSDPVRFVETDFDLTISRADYSIVKHIAEMVDIQKFDIDNEFEDWTIPKIVSRMVKVDEEDPFRHVSS